MQPSRRFIVTPTLVAMSVGIFLALASLGVSLTMPQPWDLLRFGANFGGYTVLRGEWWRLLTSAFLHYGLLHIGFNMWCLWSLGNLAERMFGSTRFLVVYLASALGGSMGSLLWHPYAIGAGASGAIFGVAGALAAFLYLGRIHLPPRVGRDLLLSVLFFIVINLIIGASIEGIDNAGHLGGLVVGTLIGAALRRRVGFYAVTAAAMAALVALTPTAKRVTAESARVFETEALLLATSGESDDALENLEAAIERDPNLPTSFVLAAQIHLEAGRYSEAIRSARRAIDLDPELEPAQQILAAALFLAGRYEEAVPELRAIIQMTPKQLQNYSMLARALVELGRAKEAVETLEEALTWDPDSAMVLSELGLVYLANDDHEKAIEVLRRAVELSPEEPEPWNRLALVLAVAGERDAALEAIDKALALAPDAPHLLDSLGTVRYYRGELDLAVQAYRDASERAPEEAVYRYNLSVALRGAGDEAAADAALAATLRLDPGFEPPKDGGPKI